LFVFGRTGGPSMSSLAQQYLVNNPDVCGITMEVRWSAIDMGPGVSPQYNWSTLLKAMQPWEAAGKTVNLLFGGASEDPGAQLDTPAYVQKQVTMITCSGAPTTPVIWQAAYANNWEAFTKAAVAEFAGDPHIGYLRFGIGQADEGVFLPKVISQPACAALWDAAGYLTQWPAWNTTYIKFLGSLHCTKDLQIGLNDGNDFPVMGNDASVASYYKIGLGIESLRAADATDILTGHTCNASYDWCSIFNQYAGKVPLHIMTLAMTTPAGGPTNMGTLPPLLQAGLQIRGQIFEIYLEDWLLAFDPSYPGYATYHASYAAALDAAAAVVGTGA
jgi:hypothetical protein